MSDNDLIIEKRKLQSDKKNIISHLDNINQKLKRIEQQIRQIDTEKLKTQLISNGMKCIEADNLKIRDVILMDNEPYTIHEILRGGGGKHGIRKINIYARHIQNNEKKYNIFRFDDVVVLATLPII